MKIAKIILLLIVFLPKLSAAQGDFKQGYAITVKGDTLKGYIQVTDINSSPKEILFKSIPDAQVIQLSPAEIKYFRVDKGAPYEKYTGAVTTGKAGPGKVMNMSVFLKVLTKGKDVWVFSYTDNTNTHFFIAERPGFVPVELVLEEKAYVKQLLALASKNDVLTGALQNSIRNASYNETDLLEIAGQINGTSDPEYNTSYMDEPVARWFVGAGINMDKIYPGNGSNYYKAGGRASTCYLPQASFGVNLYVKPKSEAIFFRAEATLGQSKYDYSYQNKIYPYTMFRTTFDELVFSVNPQVIFNFYNSEDLKLFIGAGASLNFIKYSNVYYGPKDHNPAYNDAIDNGFDFNTFDNRFLLKAGIQVGSRWVIYGNYFSSMSATKLGYFELSSSLKQIGLNYLFK